MEQTENPTIPPIEQAPYAELDQLLTRLVEVCKQLDVGLAMAVVRPADGTSRCYMGGMTNDVAYAVTMLQARVNARIVIEQDVNGMIMRGMEDAKGGETP